MIIVNYFHIYLTIYLFFFLNNLALAILNTLPNRQRTLKINMMIAKLSLQTGKFACAVNAYKQIVRESPVNLEAIKGLLALNVTDIEISGIIHQCTLHKTNL